MVKFLIKRPIAVIITFISFMMLGLVSSLQLPISLIPEVDIPEITVQFHVGDRTALELEQEIVKPFREQLKQLSYLEELKSSTRDGIATISLRFSYGRNINYAFNEVNDKVDLALRNMPKEVARPSILKASSSDIPVFYINTALKDPHASVQKQLEMSRYVQDVVRRRLEQLPEVAMVDITGKRVSQISIYPNQKKLQSLGIKEDDITNALHQHNQNFGTIEVKDGQYRYGVQFANGLVNTQDVKEIYFNVNGHLLQLKDIAEVVKEPKELKGLFLWNEKQAVTMAIVKQSDAQLETLTQKVDRQLKSFEENTPDIEYSIVRDQTGILKYAIHNLFQSLWWGGLLAFLVMFIFLKDGRSPWLIGVSVPISLVISLFLFYLLGISINIISLSGLILGVGMMIDNSIIVIDNITQKTASGDTLFDSCVNGTNEVIRPLISSVLTTCAVFIPLVFLSGISGALFYDQAMAVSIGLASSLIVSIILIPTLYHLIWLRKGNQKKGDDVTQRSFGVFSSTDLYEKGWHWVFAHRKGIFTSFFGLILIALLLAKQMHKERFPVLQKSTMVLHIDWNERIHVRENEKRVRALLSRFANTTLRSHNFVGTQQFYRNNSESLTENECMLYWELRSGIKRDDIEKQVGELIQERYPLAHLDISTPKSSFQQLFEADKAPLVMNIQANKPLKYMQVDSLNDLVSQFNIAFPYAKISPFASQSYVSLHVLPKKLARYHVSQQNIYYILRQRLKSVQVEALRDGTTLLPIMLCDRATSISQILGETTVVNSKNKQIPLRALVAIVHKNQFKTIEADRTGVIFPFKFTSIGTGEVKEIQHDAKHFIEKYGYGQANFGGEIFNTEASLKELLVVLSVALSLLYFILAAQFESLVQPIIVLLEVPMDIAGALFLLWIFGGAINLMSMIGIVVMCGIIINDSILKIDTINQLRIQGYEIKHAIEEGGRRRLKPILMTSITTILALIPFLFGEDLGSILQRPLALVIIGGMTLGTFVSLYFVPLCYFYFCKDQNKL
ncbi:efflux RND transporter permease subunit [Halosquirtibacter laminarini]|uniref:Efflux RND transporter permease subunit n=1 Tax=Halosquirtibacter laminarini TaxID=3374600 RepID=A0AC61NHH1_9BACT|nr:efflux RND transporter permease subunit [Prolixibacteraceae bacterium]